MCVTRTILKYKYCVFCWFQKKEKYNTVTMGWDKDESIALWKVYAATALSILIGFILTLILIRIYNYFTLKLCYSQTNLRGKTVIITGANSGKEDFYGLEYTFGYLCRYSLNSFIQIVF